MGGQCARPTGVLPLAMVGPVAQLVALACHFNGRAKGIPAPDFASNSMNEFCEYVRFFAPGRSWFRTKPGLQLEAETPEEWFAKEVRRNKRATLMYGSSADPATSVRMSAGFIGGGGSWQLGITDSTQADTWVSTWEVGNQHASDRRICRCATPRLRIK